MQVQTFAIGAPVNFVVTSPGGSTYPGEPVGTEAWVVVQTILLPENGDYLVTLSTPDDASPTIYGISFSMEGEETQPERIYFAPGETSARVRGQFTAPGRKEYILNAAVGQVMQVLIDTPGSSIPLDLKITSPNGSLWTGYDGGGIGSAFKAIMLPESGDYLITLTTPADAPAMRYEAGFDVITPALPGASPERVDFEGRGAKQAGRSGALVAGGAKTYVLSALAGETLKVESFASGAPVNFVVTSPGGSTYAGESISTEPWAFERILLLSENGDYLVTVSSPGGANPTTYGISFLIEEVEAEPERVDFAPGETSATRTGVIEVGVHVKKYVLNASQGQRLRLTVTTATPDDASISISVTLSGTNEVLGSTGDDNSLTVEIPVTGDYVVRLSTARAAGDTSYTVLFEIE
jgi:hypothetical protein